MKVLVLAQVPPPVHGQSVMVSAMIRDLPSLGIEVRHVPLALSRSHGEIGRWQPRKALAAIRAGLAARRAARAEAFDALYYVPAPGKRGALWRDLVVLGFARPALPRLVLHWHAPGLGAWIDANATSWERAGAQRRLGGADLSLVLSPDLASDAGMFHPLRTEVVANGIPDPGESAPRTTGSPVEVLFLGTGSRAKGLLDTAEAVAELQHRRPGAFRLTFAGGFATRADELDFKRWEQASGGAIRRAGFVDGAEKHALLSQTDVFCFPTHYAHEGQPLALIDAMAHDVRIVTTRWRAIPGMVPAENVWFVEPGRPSSLASALENAAGAVSPGGALRRHYLAHFTVERHLAALRDALLLLGPR
jgi:glycosyltransferase involved in cell wall biosynthesis